MNPSSKGWLKQYIQEYYLNNDIINALYNKNEILDNEKLLYRITQTTGLIYGYPSNFFLVNTKKISEWNDKEKIKLIITEGFLNYYLCYKNKSITKHNDILNNLDHIIKNIADFYKVIFPKISYSAATKDNYEFVEKVIDKRINVKYKLTGNFWTSMFQNNLIFLDLAYFSRYINENYITSIEEREETKLLIIKIIAAAAHSSYSIEKEEKKMFEYFLHSAHLSPGNIKLAKEYFKNGIKIEDIELNQISSWIIRKFCLEIAILTIWSDRVVTENEKDFIIDLSNKLNFDEIEMESSMIAIESFVLNNADKVFYLGNKQNYQVLSKSLTSKLTKMVKKNKSMIAQEISESKELVELLAKSRNQKLSAEEKKKVKGQLFDILRTIPSFAIFMVPGGSILLPILLKIIPENIMKPSSFINKE